MEDDSRMNRNEFLVCREYASIDLAFTLYNLYEMLFGEEDEEIKALYGAPEKGYYDWFVRELRKVLSVVADDDVTAAQKVVSEAEAQLRELRRENKQRMEFFTTLTDRLVVYEHVLNRCELRYAPQEKLDAFLRSNPDDEIMIQINLYVGGPDKDPKTAMQRIQSLVGEIPTQLTKQKLFELIDHAMTLYEGSDETALDEFLYMLRMAGRVFQTGSYIGEYPTLEKPLHDFEQTDLKEMDEERYNTLRDEIFELSGKLSFIIDYYNDLQRCTNDLLALCLAKKWLPGSDKMFTEAERTAIEACLSGEPDDGAFVPLEGHIEGVSEKLNAQMAKVVAPDMNAEEEEEYLDVATIARLLSNSIYAEIDPLFVESRTVTKELIREKEDVFFGELSEVFASVQRPVKKAIFAKIIENLPPMFSSAEEFTGYVRLNLFGCRDISERCASIAIVKQLCIEGE